MQRAGGAPPESLKGRMSFDVHPRQTPFARTSAHPDVVRHDPLLSCACGRQTGNVGSGPTSVRPSEDANVEIKHTVHCAKLFMNAHSLIVHEDSRQETGFF